MQKVILDTNVIVSALIQKNYPYLILDYCIEGNATICISNAMLQEYIEVLRRPKFAGFIDFKTNADFLIARISEMAETYEPTHKLNIIADEPDNRLLELAKISNANFIITGNTNDFTMKVFEQTKIVSPKKYWEDYR
ncbi:putative toxin-antitoxin system toxin component, PIN family [Subsaximicrobium wynnwilliamsii]|uniref:Putative toxin-antitoxin system toxin component, PIN family n=1 Tax=Subsaximicrobium wynnwilliamsii TaxID=291179 RepID=A0A5C6ZEZ4_9FLAO|nr:putative toxin-antitoxin system toxin component, PIN family [Subsaximicrobium wynnwilliamsii]TXD82498.1 putative toxin-antitoxin system toxin component, PIN family [Subsaximicrobium wynnwilliamsii]TXD88141.1 putative toxin-antitoxin system toxin component, PIN family [Subsaximicrobium wynnwilliamsii]TXE02156.1 putative toxin-antitoxin system toxin component, PIN family [Subsaximicrobium wynnwilliamsii]